MFLFSFRSVFNIFKRFFSIRYRKNSISKLYYRRNMFDIEEKCTISKHFYSKKNVFLNKDSFQSALFRFDQYFSFLNVFVSFRYRNNSISKLYYRRTCIIVDIPNRYLACPESVLYSPQSPASVLSCICSVLFSIHTVQQPSCTASDLS